MTCKKCGATLVEGASFCTKCGERVDYVPNTQDTADTQNSRYNGVEDEAVRAKYIFDKSTDMGRVTYKRIHTEASVIDTGLKIEKTTKKIFRKAKEENQYIPFEHMLFAKIHTAWDYWDTLFGICFAVIGVMCIFSSLIPAAISCLCAAALFLWCGYGKKVVFTLRNGDKYSIPYKSADNESIPLVNQCVANISTSPSFEPSTSMPPLKNTGAKKVAVILKTAVAAVIAVIFSVIVVLGNAPKIDYEATVKKSTPFSDSLGLPYTYEEVLDKYLSMSIWSSNKTEDGADVIVLGSTTGTYEDITVTIEVIPEKWSKTAIITPKSVKIGDEEISNENEVSSFLLRLFQAYDEGYSDYAEIVKENSPSENQNESKLVEKENVTSEIQENKSVESSNNVESEVPVESYKYATVREYLNDPDVQAELNQMIESMIAEDDTMSVSVDGGDNVLIYTFAFSQEALEGVDVSELCTILDEELDNTASVFEDIANSLAEVVKAENIEVTVIYTKYDGNILVDKHFEAKK